MSLVTVAVGALLAACFVLLARRAAREDRILAIGLAVAAAIYLVFAVLHGAAGGEVAVELAGVAVFSLVAWAGVRVSPWWLALGWAAHVLWDVALHPPGTDFWVPKWYGPLCIGFDLVVAFYVAVRSVRAATE